MKKSGAIPNVFINNFKTQKKKMKKFFIFGILAIMSAVVFSQTSKQVTLKPAQYYLMYTGIAADSINAATKDSTWNMVVRLNKGDGVLYNAKVKVQDLTAGATAKIILQGRNFATDSWTTITTKAWKGGGTDTTVLFTNVSSKIYYRHLNFKLSGTANKAKLSYINLSIKK